MIDKSLVPRTIFFDLDSGIGRRTSFFDSGYITPTIFPLMSKKTPKAAPGIPLFVKSVLTFGVNSAVGNSSEFRSPEFAPALFDCAPAEAEVSSTATQ
jgi:hypothetical protein